MGRTRAAVIAILLAGCTAGENDGTSRATRREAAEREPIESSEPAHPDAYAVGSPECRSCKADSDEACGHEIRWECSGGGSCGRTLPCDPICCGASGAQTVGLDEGPWGPILAAAAADEQPPSGVLVQHRSDALIFVRPVLEAGDPTTLLRLPQPIEAWRWSAMHRTIVFVADEKLYQFDLATRAAAEVPKVRVSIRGTDLETGDGFDVTASGDKAMVMRFGYARSMADSIDLGDGSIVRWTAPSSGLQRPDWHPLATHVGFEYELGPRTHVRIVDAAGKTSVDTPWALADLHAPAWHPSGAFLAAWRVDEDGTRLVFFEPFGGRHVETAIHGWPARAVAFSPDGRHLAWVSAQEGDAQGTIRLAKISATSERPGIVTSHAARSELQWLDDQAAQAMH